MAEGRGRDAWNRHSILLAILANANRKPGSPTIHPDRFNPYKQGRGGFNSNKDTLRSMFSNLKPREK